MALKLALDPQGAKKARDHLNEARKIAGIGLAQAAARSAYYAAFHAAQSFKKRGGLMLPSGAANPSAIMVNCL